MKGSIALPKVVHGLIRRDAESRCTNCTRSGVTKSSDRVQQDQAVLRADCAAGGADCFRLQFQDIVRIVREPGTALDLANVVDLKHLINVGGVRVLVIEGRLNDSWADDIRPLRPVRRSVTVMYLAGGSSLPSSLVVLLRRLVACTPSSTAMGPFDLMNTFVPSVGIWNVGSVT